MSSFTLLFIETETTGEVQAESTITVFHSSFHRNIEIANIETTRLGTIRFHSSFHRNYYIVAPDGLKELKFVSLFFS